MNRLLAKATALYEKGRFERAMIVAKRVLASDRNNEIALFYVAHGLYYAGQFRRSLQYWKRLKSICPNEPNLHLNIGACYDDLGESTLAVKYFKRELKLNPVSGTTLYNLGALYYRAHKYKRAVGYLERCYSQKHSVEAVVGKLAWCYFKTRQPEKEQILYEEYLQTHPDNIWALNNLGSHLMGQGQYYRALLRLRKAALIDPADKLVAKNIRKVQRIIQKSRTN